MEIQRKIDHYFLLFFLGLQQLIAIACAIYYFYNAQALLVVMFSAISSAILLALACYCIFSLYRLTQWILLFALMAGHFFLIIASSDQLSAIWCLTMVPIVGLLLGHLRAVIALVCLFTSAIIYLLVELPAWVTLKYDGILMLRFLFSYGLLVTYSMVMEKFRFTDLRQKNIRHLDDKNNELQDILTAILHRHRVEQQLKQRYRQYELGNSYFCVVVTDLDNCKAINDHYGRAVGDQALKKLGHFLRQELREDDLAGRWSGNQFILILPNIPQKSAAMIAERIRLKASQIELFSQGDQIKFSLSIWVCSTENSTGLDDLLSIAENCVYQAKKMGRNLVVSA